MIAPDVVACAALAGFGLALAGSSFLLKLRDEARRRREYRRKLRAYHSALQSHR